MKSWMTLIIAPVMLVACSDSQYTNEYRYNAFTVQYKLNKEDSVGSIGATYGDRIYYFSTEKGIPGVYSMRTDGSDVRFEVETTDVQKLHLDGDTLYYLSMEKVFYGSKGEQWGNRFYTLQSIDLKTEEKKSYNDIDQEMIKKKYSADFRGIWDFYYLGEDRFILSDISLDSPRGRFSLNSYLVDLEGELGNFGEKKSVDLKLEKGKYFEELALYSVGEGVDMLLVYRLKEGFEIYSDHFSVYDSRKNSSFTIMDTSITGHTEPRIFYKKGNTYLIGSQSYIMEYDAEKEEIVHRCAFDEKVEKLLVFDEKYVLAKFKNRDEIHTLNKEIFTAEKLLENRKGRIVDIHKDYYIVLGENAVYKKSLADGRELWKIKLKKNYIKKEHKVEMVGDWLFIKSFDVKTERSKLEEKINVVKGERTEMEEK